MIIEAGVGIGTLTFKLEDQRRILGHTYLALLVSLRSYILFGVVWLDLCCWCYEACVHFFYIEFVVYLRSSNSQSNLRFFVQIYLCLSEIS